MKSYISLLLEAGGMLIRADLGSLGAKGKVAFYIPDTRRGTRHSYKIYFTRVLEGNYSGIDLWIEELKIE